MLDLTQTLILVVIVILTTLLVVIGIQVIFILRDFRQATKRLTRLVDTGERMLGTLNGPVNNLAHLADGLKQGVKAVEVVTGFLNHKRSEGMLKELSEPPTYD